MSIAHSVGAAGRQRVLTPDKPKRSSLLTWPALIVVLIGQAIMSVWFFRASIQGQSDLARAVMLGCIPLAAIWSAISLLRSMRTAPARNPLN